MLLFICLHSSGQAKYWIKQEHKVMVQQLISKQPTFCSEWLDHCSFELDINEIDLLNVEGIVTSPVWNFAPSSQQMKKGTLGFALEQVESHYFIEKKLTGKGVKIGIIDGGFLDADNTESLSYFFKNGLVRYYKDYVTPELEDYGGLAGLDDNHGTEVWQLIGGYTQKKDILYGLATEAEYYLARTDHGAFEKRIEEDLLIKAIEDMDSMGVKLINISLGYNIGFTNPNENYQPDQMDGQTSMIAKAVDIAATEKGMLIVVAAGNEGTIKWQTLSTPGDARYALTVGASKLDIWDKMNYSSTGPEYTDFVKPDVSVYSAQGTSYSAPIITGMAACLWQLDSSLTNFEIMDLFKKAGNFYPYPNNYLGYGVPTCKSILDTYDQKPIILPDSIKTDKSSIQIKVPENIKYMVAFHKEDATHVISRNTYHPQGKKLKIKKAEGSTRTSVLLQTKVIEIFWE